MRILVTGGAGFIGLNLVKKLAAAGHQVVVIDNLLEQVHGHSACFPDYAVPVQTIQLDICNKKLLRTVIKQGFDLVYHLAALTGVGQSMYHVREYINVNCVGTATLMESIIEAGQPYPRVVLSSSRAVYGEGGVRCLACGEEFYPLARAVERLDQHLWEHPCPLCGADSEPLPGLETTPTNPSSIYGISKLNQEQICQILGKAYAIPVIVLRYFNVYGPGQSPRNPYTGILSIFSRRLLNNQNIEIYEDGKETRDFVYIDDVVQANLLAGAKSALPGIYNICAGENSSVYQVGLLLARIKGFNADRVNITGKFRVGDIRHGIGSWDLAAHQLGYRPHFNLGEGLNALLSWVETQHLLGSLDLDQRAEIELTERRLLRS